MLLPRGTKEKLMALENVVAVGEGIKRKKGIPYRDQVAAVSVRRKLPEIELAPEQIVPKVIDGIPTDVVTVHVIKAQGAMDYMRPLLGGASVGHGDITAGTGWCLEDRGRRLLASNNHVLANSNEGKIGDIIYQPGPYDWPTSPADVQNAKYEIGDLARFVPLVFQTDGGGDTPTECPIGNGYAAFGNFFAYVLGHATRVRVVVPGAKPQAIPVNYVDAALAEPYHRDDLSLEIMEIGMVKGIADIGIGESMIKFGRTTGKTKGVVEQINVMVDVSYGAGKVARFDGQILTSAMSQGGDSGSLGLDVENNAVAQLFAGSDTCTIFNPIGLVMSALGLGGLF